VAREFRRAVSLLVSAPFRGTPGRVSQSYRLPLGTLLLAVVVPFSWIACGGSKPPATPDDENTASASSGEPAAADISSAAPASSSAGDDSSSTPPAASATTAAAPPPAPFGGTDCGQCVDKTCAKPVAACGKNSDCQSTLDGIHSCGSDTGAAACIANASNPASGKPKKLAAAYEACAKKAIAKACSAKCQ